jgi:chemotaxis protein methyltransferase CheR
MALMPLRQHKIQDIEIEMILLALKQRWGYDFSGYARASLKRRLLHLVDYFEVDCLSRLLPTLLYDEPVAQTLINAISVPTSEFFRDPLVWLAIRNDLIPRLSSFPRINLWQVGCGHGQETYTLAILLHEVGILKKVRLITTDINATFLEQARQGCWPARDFAAWRENYRIAGGKEHFEQYFKIDADNLRIMPHFANNIEFVQHNLVVDDAFLETQFIICRNVLIYFGLSLQERVLDVFSRSLARGGYLLLGRSETVLENQQTILHRENFNDNIHLYRKVIWTDCV